MSIKILSYPELVLCVQNWLLGEGNLLDVAVALNLTHSSLSKLLLQSGLADVTGAPQDEPSVQDVLNSIFLWFAVHNRTDIRSRGKRW